MWSSRDRLGIKVFGFLMIVCCSLFYPCVLDGFGFPLLSILSISVKFSFPLKKRFLRKAQKFNKCNDDKLKYEYRWWK